MNLRKTCLAFTLALGCAALPASAQEADKAADLFELLDLVEQGLETEKEENRQRLAEFENAKDEQERLLSEAKEKLKALEELSLLYEGNYNDNERRIGELEADLAEQLGQMGELFGVVRQVSNDLSGQIWDSLISAQLQGRKEMLDQLGRSKELPSTDDLERLWYELQQEMTQQGEVVRFNTSVLTSEGQTEAMDVVRAGPFNAVANGKFLVWEPSENKLRELTRQPPSKYLSTVEPFEELFVGGAVLALEPSRGTLLSALTDTPSVTERIGQGGAVGAVIITLGSAAFLLGLFRWFIIWRTGRRVAAQQQSDYVDKGNPLGRVLAVYEDNRDVDAETLELKLDEAVLRESSSVTRLIWIVKTVSALAPLLGLLGTVTGMIQTFQAITLFGAGDPKMMAGGISEALVTTMLGLCAAIPLVLLYDTLANSTRYIIDVLDEQSAGLIAARSERDHVGD